MEHFWRLNTSRSYGFSGPLPIPWTAIDAYAERYEFTDTDVDYDDFVFYISALDDKYIEHAYKDQEKNGPR